MDIGEMADALHRLVRCPDLNLENLEEETIQALIEARSVLDTYWEELSTGTSVKEVLEGYPYMPLDKIPGYKGDRAE